MFSSLGGCTSMGVYLSGERDTLVPLKHLYSRHMIVLKIACAEKDRKCLFSVACENEVSESSL